MIEKRDQILARLLLGDGLTDLLNQIDDSAVADTLATHLWAGIDHKPVNADIADVYGCDRAPPTTPDHPVAATPINKLERDAVIDRLIDEGTLDPPENQLYDVEHDVAANAYRLGRRDERRCTPIPDESVRIPETDTEDEVRYEHLDKEVAERIIEYYEAAAPGGLHHTLMLLGWHTGMRLCSLHSIDLRDIDDEEYSIKLRHRPATGTTLKDGVESEHKVGIAPEVMDVLERYIEYHRPDVENEHGREPLFTRKQGRRSKSNLREYVYEATQPCQIGLECPHGRDPQACDAAIRRNDASKCPLSVSPHAIRKGAITHWCDEDVPREKISGRADVTRAVIEKHYD